MLKWLTRFLVVVSFFAGCYYFFELLTYPHRFMVIPPSSKPVLTAAQFKVSSENLEFLGIQKLKVDPALYKDKEVVLYFVPHPDDEVLTYGVPILNDIHEKKEVFLVLLSHGESSGAHDTVNQLAKKPVSTQTFGMARVKEFKRACWALGVPPNHIQIYNMPSGYYDPFTISRIAKYYQSLFPNIIFVGMSQKDILSDHNITGKVLAELKQKGEIHKMRVFASMYMSRLAKNRLKGKRIKLIHPADAKKLKKAIKAYQIWNPQRGWYSIGYISVRPQFELLERQKYSVITEK